jgi:hypothetical protein
MTMIRKRLSALFMMALMTPQTGRAMRRCQKRLLRSRLRLLNRQRTQTPLLFLRETHSISKKALKELF